MIFLPIESKKVGLRGDAIKVQRWKFENGFKKKKDLQI